MKVKKKCRHHLLYADVIHFFATKKCQKTRKIDENLNIERENLHIFLTTWGTLMKFSVKMWLNIKSHTKNKALYKKIHIWKKLRLLSKSEVKEHFPRFSSFRFCPILGNLGNFISYVYFYVCFISIWCNISLYRYKFYLKRDYKLE